MVKTKLFQGLEEGSIPSRDVVWNMYRLQVVSGTGGEESKSFSKELFDLYLDIFKHLGVLEKFDCGEQIIIFKDVQTYDLFL